MAEHVGRRCQACGISLVLTPPGRTYCNLCQPARQDQVTCPDCNGKGYRVYVSDVWDAADAPTEVDCKRCKGTGLA